MVELSGRDRDLLAAGPSVPAIIALLYGAYKFYDLGFATDNYLYTYVPILGATISVVCVLLYVNLIGKPGRSVIKSLIALSGFIPYAYSLYLMGFLGAYSLWLLLSNFTIGGLVFGLFWIVVGYRMLYTFWKITEISVKDS